MMKIKAKFKKKICSFKLLIKQRRLMRNKIKNILNKINLLVFELTNFAQTFWILKGIKDIGISK